MYRETWKLTTQAQGMVQAQKIPEKTLGLQFRLILDMEHQPMAVTKLPNNKNNEQNPENPGERRI